MYKFMDYTSDQLLSVITGEQLSAVTFVMDYITLEFDGPRLMTFTCPNVQVDGKLFRSEEQGYRDALCQQIAKVVHKVTVDDARIYIEFDDSSSISVSLLGEDWVPGQAESAMFINGNECEVWN